MDPQEINKPKLTIPEQPQNDVENAAEFTQHPVIDKLADAGHIHDPHIHDPKETFYDHLERINDEIDKIHGTETRTVDQPSDESIRQIEHPHILTASDSITSTTHNTDTKPQTPIGTSLVANIAMPFEYVGKGITTFLKSLTKFGSASSPIFNGHTTVSELPLPQKSYIDTVQNVTPFPAEQNVQEAAHDKSPGEKSNIVEFPQQEVQPHAA